MSVFRAQLIIHLKKVFIGNEKKLINILTACLISHKSDIKIFLKLIINECLKGTSAQEIAVHILMKDVWILEERGA